MNDTAIGTATFGIAQRLERLPMTSYQKTLFLIIATAWLFDSMDLGMMTFILGSIKTEFGLTTVQTGLLGSASFLGMFLKEGKFMHAKAIMEVLKWLPGATERAELRK